MRPTGVISLFPLGLWAIFSLEFKFQRYTEVIQVLQVTVLFINLSSYLSVIGTASPGVTACNFKYQDRPQASTFCDLSPLFVEKNAFVQNTNVHA